MNNLVIYDEPLQIEHARVMQPVRYTRPHHYDEPEDVGAPRTRKAMVRILLELQTWGMDNLPEGKVFHSFRDAIQDLLALEVTCWTEIDEALSRFKSAWRNIETGAGYLNRWQDRGGRIGNVSGPGDE